jgi:hypothetical protein
MALRSGSKIITSEAQEKKSLKARNNLLLFLLWAALFVLFINILGYFITIFIYLGVFLWAMGERPWYKVLVFDIAMVVFIHFVFIKWIGLPLPKGLLKGIL